MHLLLDGFSIAFAYVPIEEKKNRGDNVKTFAVVKLNNRNNKNKMIVKVKMSMIKKMIFLCEIIKHYIWKCLQDHITTSNIELL